MKHVLVVDDDSDNRRLVAACLRALGEVVVHEASDGLDALRAVLQYEPDLILLDMDLPLLDGYRAARMIRLCSPRAALVPIVALTAASESDARTRCLRAGATDYVAKPLADLSILRAKVGALLRVPHGGSAPSLAHYVR